jgi:hypothetical protein
MFTSKAGAFLGKHFMPSLMFESKVPSRAGFRHCASLEDLPGPNTLAESGVLTGENLKAVWAEFSTLS